MDRLSAKEHLEKSSNIRFMEFINVAAGIGGLVASAYAVKVGVDRDQGNLLIMGGISGLVSGVNFGFSRINHGIANYHEQTAAILTAHEYTSDSAITSNSENIL